MKLINLAVPFLLLVYFARKSQFCKISSEMNTDNSKTLCIPTRRVVEKRQTPIT